MQRIEVEDEHALQRLDRLAQEEAWMTTTELLGIAHRIDDRVNGVDSRVECVYNKVQGIGKKAQDVGKSSRCKASMIKCMMMAIGCKASITR